MITLQFKNLKLLQIVSNFLTQHCNLLALKSDSPDANSSDSDLSFVSESQETKSQPSLMPPQLQ